MGDSKIDLDSLIMEALNNARVDRVSALEAYDGVKKALSLADDEDLKNTMLVGDKPIKLLEQMTRSNEQIVRLAQIAEKRDSKKKEVKKTPISMEDIKKSLSDDDLEDLEEEVPQVRVENESTK